MKYDTIYRTVKASERLPEDKEKTHFVIYGSTDAKGTLHKDYFQQWKTKVWLEPLTNRYVFDQKQLIALLKTSVQMADAGRVLTIDEMIKQSQQGE